MLENILQEAKGTLRLMDSAGFITDYRSLTQACLLEDYRQAIAALGAIDRKQTLAEKQSAFVEYARVRREDAPGTQLDMLNETQGLGNALMLQCHACLFPNATPEQIWATFAPEVKQWHELSIEAPKKMGRSNYKYIVVNAQQTEPDGLNTGYLVVGNTALRIHLGAALLPNIYALLKTQYPQHLELLLAHPQQGAIFHALATYDAAMTPRAAIQRLAAALLRGGRTHAGNDWATAAATQARDEFLGWFSTLPEAQQAQLENVVANRYSLGKLIVQLKNGECAETMSHQLDAFVESPSGLLDVSHALGPKEKRALYDKIVADAKQIGSKPFSMTATTLPLSLLNTVFENIIVRIVAAREFFPTSKLIELLNTFNDHNTYHAIVMQPAVMAIVKNPSQFSQVLTLLTAGKIKTLFTVLATHGSLIEIIPNLGALATLLSGLEKGQRSVVLTAMQACLPVLIEYASKLNTSLNTTLIDLFCHLSAAGSLGLLNKITASDRAYLFKSAFFIGINTQLLAAIATAYNESQSSSMWQSMFSVFGQAKPAHITLLHQQYMQFKQQYLANNSNENNINITALDNMPLHERWAFVLLIARQNPQSVVANVLSALRLDEASPNAENIALGRARF